MKFFFVGIAGTAMGNVARLLGEMGHSVRGSDRNIYPPMSEVLERAEIVVEEGFDPSRIASWKPDQVVIGNAVTRGNPEVEWLLNTRTCPMVSLPELIRDQLLGTRRTIVIAGTHGKTTTAAIAAHLLLENGLSPGWLIGGVPRDLPSGAELGNPDHPFVIEGDEYDSAFFDKRSKFIHYRPNILTINHLEFDHGDIFRDLEDVQRAFRHLLRIVPENGRLLVNLDEPSIRELLPVPWTQVSSVGEGPENNLRIHDWKGGPAGSTFQLTWCEQPWGEVQWELGGRFNARNAAMAALAAGYALSPENPTELHLDGLARFTGVRRRQETRFQDALRVLIEDFGHHPTAIRETLSAIRERFPGAALVAAFEPRSNTAVTRVFEEEWRDAFSGADEVYLGPIYRGETLADGVRLDTEELASALRGRGSLARSYSSFENLEADLVQRLAPPAESPTVVVVFTNGAFGGMIPRLVEMLTVCRT